MTGALINIFTFRGGGGIFSRGAYLAGALIWQWRLFIFLLLGGGGGLFSRGAYLAGALIRQ